VQPSNDTSAVDVPESGGTTPPPRSLGARLIHLAQRVIPWISLGVGIVGALLMDRGPARGRIVAVVAVASWLVLLAALWLERRRELAGNDAPALVRTAHFSVLMITQSSIHLQLYFALPFYFKAYAPTVAQTVFMVVLCGAALASLWDPLTEWMMSRTRWGLLLPSLANFVVLAAVLPGLGISNGAALWWAAAATSLALPALAVVHRIRGARGWTALVQAVLVAAVIPVALLVGAARAVPAVPMGLVDGAIGTRRVGNEVTEPIEHLDRAPRTLVCATAIFAPLGVREKMLHVWRHDGIVVDRIELEIRGGREGGFRTYSVKHEFGKDPRGTWSCAVETESGQFLGERVITIGSNEPAQDQ
jgi:hypothetical protein